MDKMHKINGKNQQRQQDLTISTSNLIISFF